MWLFKDCMKDILIVKFNALLPENVKNRLREDIKKQMEEKVVIIPAYAEAKLISKPDDVEVQIECKQETHEFLEKELHI